jgi:hypothetical protein
VLDTGYRMRTPVNGYAALWGELFLGDLEGNLLALVKQRAERCQATCITPTVQPTAKIGIGA